MPLLFLFIITGLYLFSDFNENLDNDSQLISSNTDTAAAKESIEISDEKVEDIPDEGMYSFIGMTSKELEGVLGKPSRIDPSAYDYNWWIYNGNPKQYMQIGILNDKVVTVFGIGDEVRVDPFKIGQPVDDIFRQFQIKQTVTLKSEHYRFELKEAEMNTRPLLSIGDVYIQLYFDSFTKKLSSVRFMDEQTLIKQRPYELIYRGDLLSAEEISSGKWKKIEGGAVFQILDITNIMRERHGLHPVKWDHKTALVAYNHSKEMSVEDYFSHTSPKKGGLAERLAMEEVLYQFAGENIAAKYVDGIAAVEGWLNSEGHRETLLNDKFTHLGVGVYEKYYTQNFIQKWE